MERISGEIFGLKGEISGLKTEVRSLEKRMEEGQSFVHQEIGSLREEMRQGQVGLRGELSSLREEMRQGLAHTNKRLNEPVDIEEFARAARRETDFIPLRLPRSELFRIVNLAQ